MSAYKATTSRRRALAAVAVVATALASALATAACTTTPAAPAAGAAPPAWAANLQPQLEHLARDLLVTGAVIQVHSPGHGDWTSTIGTRTFQGSDPVQVGDHIRIGSITKTWTGTVVLQLVDEGRLRLDDPVAKYRPDVPNGQNITIEQLLDMRSGLGNYTVDPELSRRIDADHDTVFQPEELIKMGLAMPVKFPPGQGYYYSNTNTVLLGRIVEQLTGNALEAEIQRRILTPLGLSAVVLPGPPRRPPCPNPAPTATSTAPGRETVNTNVLAPDKQAAARPARSRPIDETLTNPSWGWAAGAGISTADDLTRYVQALVDGTLLSPHLQKTRLASVQPTDPTNPQAAGYGLALAQFGPLLRPHR